MKDIVAIAVLIGDLLLPAVYSTERIVIFISVALRLEPMLAFQSGIYQSVGTSSLDNCVCVVEIYRELGLQGKQRLW